MLSIGSTDIYTFVGSVLLYLAVAIQWRKLSALTSAAVTVGLIFAYTAAGQLFFSVILQVPFSALAFINLLFGAIVQGVVAYVVFRQIRSAQAESTTSWRVWLAVGLVAIFFIAPIVSSLILRLVNF